MNRIISGTIFRFPLPLGLGHAYCKLVDFSNVTKHFGIIIKVYDYFENEKIEDAAFFKDFPLFMNPIPIATMPSLRGKFAWTRIGVLREYSDGDIPIFKKGVLEGFGYEKLEDYKSMKWYARVNFNENVGPVNFDKVRHLEELYWRSTITIEKRVAMQLLRYEGIDVADFLSKDPSIKNWRVDFNTQKYIPLYKTLPEPIRGKPLIKGWVPDEYLDWKWE